ncbi:DUF1559 domain-containing protein [Lacunimicrobium album]
MLKSLVWGGTSLLIGLVLVAIFLPERRNGREAARRTTCKNNLKQIGIALHNYHDEYGMFPPAYTVDAEGNKLHSWRTLILPYMEQAALYKAIDLTKPWDDPVNEVVRQTSLPVYHCPSSGGSGAPNHTNYLAFVGDDLAFPHAKSRTQQDFTDGLGETILVVDVPEQNMVEWMSPNDADEEMYQSFQPESEISHRGVVQILLGDGAVRTVTVTLPSEKRRALMTVGGNEDVGEF